MNTKDLMNGILDELEVIKLRAEHFDKLHKQSPNITWPGDLQHVLQKLEEISQFLKAN